MNTKLVDKKTWGIIGLGWLGSAMAKELTQKNQNVWGTHRESFDFKKNIFPEDPCDILFLNTPPLLELSPAEYVKKIFLKTNSKIIFTSSTSVYGGNSGLITEASAPLPLTPSARWLVEVEQLLISRFKDQILILRLGGLIGENRHPIKYLTGKTDVPNGNDVINLVHRNDLISLILILEKISDYQVVNIVTPFHPTKIEYYNEWAVRLNISPVVFLKNESTKREIDSLYLKNIYPLWLCPKLNYL